MASHQGKKLPPNIDENAEEGDVSDEDSADEMEDDCKLMNGDVCTPTAVSFIPLHCVYLFQPPELQAGFESRCSAVEMWIVLVFT